VIFFLEFNFLGNLLQCECQIIGFIINCQNLTINEKKNFLCDPFFGHHYFFFFLFYLTWLRLLGDLCKVDLIFYSELVGFNNVQELSDDNIVVINYLEVGTTKSNCILPHSWLDNGTHIFAALLGYAFEILLERVVVEVIGSRDLTSAILEVH
jgi:hypothetical protein